MMVMKATDIKQEKISPENINIIDSAGLVFEGGGMRGLYTAGVVDAFLENGIIIKTGIGVSAGICHACSYYSLQKGRAARVILDYVDRPYYCGKRVFAKTGDFFSEQFIYHTIPEKLNKIDNAAFKQMLSRGVKLYSCVTNIKSGEAEYLEIRDMIDDIESIRASASLPLLSKKVLIDGNYYLDGGVADSIPIKKSEQLGNRKNVVILTQPRDYRKKANSSYLAIKLMYSKYPEFTRSMKLRHISYNSSLEYIKRREEEGDVFVIAPEKSFSIDRLERDKVKLCDLYAMGFADATARLAELKEFLSEK